ncbi:MAG: response regulator [Vibrio sp.]|uniref:response regulator n=1 Tax=Vibrio TaxID=662 RepID=UPI0023F948BB|nr:response regulator [Vibrio sp. VCS]
MHPSHFSESCGEENLISTEKLILLVDDDAIFRCMIKNFLEHQGYQVLEAENGLEGLRQLRENRPDLVLCDLSMPILNGMEFVEEVSLIYPSLPLIVVSATEEISDVAKALRIGIKDFLAKPIIDYHKLSRSIEHVLASSSQECDYASWFAVDDQAGLNEQKELHWHLQYLQQDPAAAKQLLAALLPATDGQHGAWKFSYRLLQSTESMPLVFDYARLNNGQFAFYAVDAASNQQWGSASTLLLYVLFHNYIRNLGNARLELKDLAEIVERGLGCAECVGPVAALFGVADLTEGKLSLLPAGLDCQWSNGLLPQSIHGGITLGENCLRNFITKDLPIGSAGQIMVNKPSAYRLSLDLQRG